MKCIKDMCLLQKYVEVIFQARKSLLYIDGEPWLKKESGSFDVKKSTIQKILGYIEMTNKPYLKTLMN